METTNYTMIKISASEGKWLTEASETENRTFAKTMFLAVNDKADNYTEWSDAEKLAWETAHPTESEVSNG